MPPSPSPRKPPQPTPGPDPVSPVAFDQVDPMDQADSSSPTALPDLITPPAKPATAAAGGAKASGSGSPATAPANPSKPTTTSSFPASFDNAGFRKLFRECVGTLGNAANERLTRTEDARAAGVWVADDHDKEDIGDPLGNLAVRRLGLAKWKNVEDLEDVVNLLAATGAYVMANVNKLVELGRKRRQAHLAQHIRADQAAENGATS